jgi:hypothetical protein
MQKEFAISFCTKNWRIDHFDIRATEPNHGTANFGDSA